MINRDAHAERRDRERRLALVQGVLPHLVAAEVTHGFVPMVVPDYGRAFGDVLVNPEGCPDRRVLLGVNSLKSQAVEHRGA